MQILWGAAPDPGAADRSPPTPPRPLMVTSSSTAASGQGQDGGWDHLFQWLILLNASAPSTRPPAHRSPQPHRPFSPSLASAPQFSLRPSLLPPRSTGGLHSGCPFTTTSTSGNPPPQGPPPGASLVCSAHLALCGEDAPNTSGPHAPSMIYTSTWLPSFTGEGRWRPHSLALTWVPPPPTPLPSTACIPCAWGAVGLRFLLPWSC